MPNIKYDFHIHSALSPCALEDMTPNNIVNMAIVAGLDAIAVTDHNSAKNVKAIMAVAKDTGLLVIPGMELETREEIHVVCLMESLENILKLQDIVYNSLPPIKNKESVFGKQEILDEEDEVVGIEDRFLLTATSLSINEVHKIVDELGGIAIPAHIDRPSYSVISNLGLIPQEIAFTTLEVSKYIDIDKYVKQYPNYRILQSSDAHELQFIGECSAVLRLDDITIKGVITSLRKFT